MAILFAFLFMILSNSIYIFLGARLAFHSDSAAANLLAREHLVTRRLIPSTWNYSTDIMVWFYNLPIAFMQLFMTDQLLMRSIAVFILYAATVWAFISSVKSIGGGKSHIFCCMLALLCSGGVSVDMLLAQGAYLPSVFWTFLCFAFFIKSIEDDTFRIVSVKYLILFLCAVFINAVFSIIILQVAVVPIIGACFIAFWFGARRDGKTYKNIITLLSLIAAVSVLALKLRGFAIKDAHLPGSRIGLMTTFGAEDILFNLGVLFRSLFTSIGYRTGVSLFSKAGIENVMIIICVASMIICPVILLIKEYSKESFKARIFILYGGIHIAEAAFMLIFCFPTGDTGTRLAEFSRYFLTSVVLLIALSGYYVYHIFKRYSYKANMTNVIILAFSICFVCLFSIDKIEYSTRNYTLKYEDRYGVIDFMAENGLEYGYADFWNAGVFTVASDFGVNISPVILNAEKPSAFHWLVSERYFQPEQHTSNTFLLLTQQEYQTLQEQYTAVLGQPVKIENYNDKFILLVYDYNICVNDFSGNTSS